MTDLSHWNFATEFSTKEAAALIVGLDPSLEQSMGESHLSKAKAVIDRIVQDTARCMVAIQNGKEQPPDSLLNKVTKRQLKNPQANSWKTVVVETLLSTDLDYKIERAEIVKWLNATGLKSIYVFDLEHGPRHNKDAPDELSQKQQDDSLKTKERNTLLCIIAALCKEAKIPFENHAKAAGLIQSAAQHMGVSIGETTIEEHLKKIPNALATRMK